MRVESHPLLDRLAADYVLGVMQVNARRRFEAAQRASPIVQAASDAWSERLHCLSRIESDQQASPGVFARIEQRIDGRLAAPSQMPSPASSSASSSGSRSRSGARSGPRWSGSRSWWSGSRSWRSGSGSWWSWWRPVAGFAIGVLVCSLVFLVQGPQYETLTSAPGPETVTHRQTLHVLFSAETTMEQTGKALRAIDATIVAGPTDLGILTVALAPGQDLDRTLATLRAQPGVLFAEPVAAGRSPR